LNKVFIRNLKTTRGKAFVYPNVKGVNMYCVC